MTIMQYAEAISAISEARTSLARARKLQAQAVTLGLATISPLITLIALLLSV